MEKAFLILEDGTVFQGEAFGASGQTIGELVFTTGMTGYVETLTDPSYYGQITMQTFPLIGNYGIIPDDFESEKCYLKGYVVQEFCDTPSNFRCRKNLNDFLKQQKILGISGIDTRELTKKIRENGVMNGMIYSFPEPPVISQKLLKSIKAYKITDAVQAVTSSKSISSENKKDCDKKYTVVLWDFGAKKNILRELEKRGCNVINVNSQTSAHDIISLNPDGIMLSNGPGDPAENTEIIKNIQKLCTFNLQQIQNKKKPISIFGICLGHQLLALARGCKTTKLKYGHRGANHPVKDLKNGRIYITSQNHGYSVKPDSLPECAKTIFINLNDETCEGLEYSDMPSFSVQFHPEACGGPHDTNFLFDDFIKMMEDNSYAIK